MLESSCKTQRLGTEEHRAIVSLSWGIWIAHYAFSLCQGGLESQNSKRSSEETGLKHFISEIFMPKRKKKKKKAARCFSALKWRNGTGRGIFLRQKLVLTSVAEGSWLSLTAASSCSSPSPAVKQP